MYELIERRKVLESYYLKCFFRIGCFSSQQSFRIEFPLGTFSFGHCFPFRHTIHKLIDDLSLQSFDSIPAWRIVSLVFSYQY